MALAWEEVDRASVALPAWLYCAATTNALNARQQRSDQGRVGWLPATVMPAPHDPVIEVTERFAARRALAQLSIEDRICVLLGAVAEMR